MCSTAVIGWETSPSFTPSLPNLALPLLKLPPACLPPQFSYLLPTYTYPPFRCHC